MAPDFPFHAEPGRGRVQRKKETEVQLTATVWREKRTGTEFVFCADSVIQIEADVYSGLTVARCWFKCFYVN